MANFELMDFSEAKDYIVERLITELPKNLYYHGAHHTFDVVKSVHSLSVAEKLSNADFFVLLTAAYFHDAGYIYRYEDNEPVAVKMVRQSLPEFGYSKEQIDVIENIIMATSSQKEPQTLLEKIMCDADHDYFGRHDYQKIAVSLRKELTYYEAEYSDEIWLKRQINYLENKHQYYTKTALDTRQPKKEHRISILKDQLANLVKI
ncbi:MAG: HD domain-containing protein [Flavobacteriales bacterium]|nr:HD domain-containing protein [Flavobacteriales bacterium]